MSHLSLMDDLLDSPLLCVNRRKRSRPFLSSFYDTLEDHFDQQVGRLFRALPSVLLELENKEPPRKKRMRDNEPKCRAVVSTKDNQFRVKLDTSSFSPEDLSVKVFGDKLAVSAKRETKSKDCYEYHEMHREFTIPEDVDPDTVTSKLSNSGELTVEAPMKSIKDSPAGRTVCIQRDTKEETVTQADKKTGTNDGEEPDKRQAAK